MAIEETIFKRAKINKNALKQYGFRQLKGTWTLERPFQNGDFKAVITVDSKGHFLGNVYETATEDEYLPLRVENMEGFALKVRHAYMEILKDIKEKCCHENLFISNQANRFTQEIEAKYGDKPVFPWDDFSGGVFKNPNNGKWYAIIMNINAQKIDKKQTGEVEIVNIKLDPQKIEELLKEKGFYPAYHMNKKYWISILLNDTVSDDLLFELLDESHTFTLSKKTGKTMIKTTRLKIYPATQEQMEAFIAHQSDETLKAAYSEMLSGSLAHKKQWNWYAIWMIELKDGTHIGELCFKGLHQNGIAEIGYGIGEKYQGQGYATEAVKAVTAWAFKQPNVTAIEAETELQNKASLRVLEKSGFIATEKNGQEGPRFILHNNITFRLETPKDYREVENMVRESFWNVYRPGCLEHFVLHELRDNPDFIKELDYVMEKDGQIIGQNIFMRAHIKADDGRNIEVLAMGPICITPHLKRQGYGKMLLDYTLEKAKEMGFGAMCFEGNIDFYAKSGFTFASKFGIRYHDLPEDADASFFLCKELIPGYLDGITGEYTPPAGYFVDEAKAEEFDKQFPPKKKEKLPGQIFG